jgi:MFS superfamily sulfate permease-like transporter
LINNYFPSGDRELFALGTCNVVAALFGGYFGNGSLPRSKMQAMAGSKTTLTGLFAAILTLIYVSFLGNVFQYLPKPSLAAVVFVASYRLIEFEDIIFIFKMKNLHEIVKFLITFLITIFFDVSTGIILCILLASLVIIQRSTSLNVSLLGEVTVADTAGKTRSTFLDLREHPEAKVLSNALLIQIRGSLEFFNASRIARRIEMLTEAVTKFSKTHTPLQTINDFDPELHHNLLFIKSEFPEDNHVSIVLDFSMNEDMDSAAILVIEKIIQKAKKHRGSQIYLVGLHKFHTELFTRAGLIDLLGSDFVKVTVEEAVEKMKLDKITRQSAQRDSIVQAMAIPVLDSTPAVVPESIPVPETSGNIISTLPYVMKITQEPEPE